MEPTFAKGDVLLGRLTTEFARWDVVGFRYYLKEDEFVHIATSRGADVTKLNYEELKKALGMPSGYFVARVVGLEGEEVHIQRDGLYIDGKRMEPPVNLTKQQLYTGFENPSEPHKVPFGRVFVMKDNHSKGMDSRKFGPVPMSNILARVVTSAKYEDLTEQQRREVGNLQLS